jgi:hypothetical protein
VVEAQHTIQQVETIALGRQASANQERSENQIPFH